jgi:alpha-L-arabinofuranosidase
MKTKIGTIAAVLVFSCFSFAQSSREPARIKIDTDRIIGEIHPHLFGNFAGHLGRCIYGGIYEPGSPTRRGEASTSTC